MFKRITALLIALFMILSLSVVAFADFGDFGGDNDFGGGSGGSYSGGSYGGGSGGSYNDNDYDRGTTEPATTTYYSYKTYPSGNVYDGAMVIMNADGEELDISVKRSEDDDSGTNAVLGAMLLGVILIVAAAVIKSKNSSGYRRKPKYNNVPVDTGVQAEKAQNLNPMSTYPGVDPGFNEVELREKLSNIYVKLQNAWQDKKLEEIRPYLTDTLYGQYDRQLDAYRRNKQTNCIERIAVLSVDLQGWKQSGDEDLIVAEIRTRIVDYVISDTDNSLVRGSRTAEKFMTYEWTLSRKTGVTTINKDGVHTVNCPNCGAPVDINKSAKCEFCGSILTTDSGDWVINSIKALSQRTVGK